MIPNHILIIGSPNSGKLRTTNIITKNKQIDINNDSHSGIIVKTDITTKYYSLKLNILIDEFPECRNFNLTEDQKLIELNKWIDEFQLDEFAELREVLDGLFFTVDMKDSINYITRILSNVERLRNILSDKLEWGGFIAIVGTSKTEEADEDIVGEIEDVVISYGFEFINLNLEGKNEYKETVGKDRIIELIESHEWSNMDLIETSEEKYTQNKQEKLNTMTDPLIKEKSMELDEIFSKLAIARDNINNIPSDKRDDFANKIINEIIDYI
ncbi:unnamed protein product [Candida verbasci]|uniref:Increased recombination centers protein 6 n=1 Tax=Candida verbasci TaxID=1227364 RepID=A0A9W4XBH9_9ASCO|nr:unnamed protein product [Candida verbasci]